MATINRKAGVLVAAATMALAITGMAAPSFAQQGPRQDRFEQYLQQHRNNSAPRPQAQPPQQQQMPARANDGGQRPNWRGGERPDGGQRPNWQNRPRPDAGQQQGRPNWSAGSSARPEGQSGGNWQRPTDAGQQARPDRNNGRPSAWRAGTDRRPDADRDRDRDRDRNPAWRADNDRRPDVDRDRTPERDRNPAWRADNDRRDNNGWRGNDGWRGNTGWRGNDRGNNGWRDNGRGDRYQAWNRNDWRRDNRYDWQRYRDRNRDTYRIGRYYAPYNGYSYRRMSIGFSLGSMFYGNRYWINDPWAYRLPPVYGPYRWVRYYDDVMMVDIYSGEVVDVIYDFFW